MRSTLFPAVLLLGCLRLIAAPPSLDAALDSLSALHEFREVALAPDGGRVAWIETAPGKITSEPASHSVYVKDLHEAGAAAKRIGDPAAMVQGLAWSHDGRLAFLSDAESHGQMQLYVVDKPGHGKPRKIGNLRGLRGRSALVAGRQKHRAATDRRSHARAWTHGSHRAGDGRHRIEDRTSSAWRS